MKNLDKLLHYLVNFFIVVFLGMINIWLGVIVAVIVSIAKELHDRKQEGNHFCWWDLLADLLGIITGVIVLLVI